jgi:hypothetical protein
MTGPVSSAARPVLAVWTLLILLFSAVAPAAATAAVPASPSAPAGAAASASAAPEPGECPGRMPVQPDEAPVLAHFYIWFTSSSWYRAKTDFPAIGRYSSNENSVMRTQVEQAREAGIDGFIVSWKSTDDLNHRLEALRGIAAEMDFKLAITYQAQDFERNPLPVAQVQRDLELLASTYASDPVFHVLGARPVVAISGTWLYSEEELRSITEPVASRLMVLATEKDVEGYRRVAPAVEGELYYWSSGDPAETAGYQEKLLAMANAAREDCGVWVAPVSPGFDAREVGGRRIVDRRDGETLRRSWEAGLATVPDMVGVISWNEFSENTHIEPSEDFGTRYVDVLRELTGAPPPPGGELDSSQARGGPSMLQTGLALSAAAGSVLLVTILGIRRRRRMGDRPAPQ